MATLPTLGERRYHYMGGFDGRLARLRELICPLAPILRRIPRGATHLDVGCGRGILLVVAAVEKGTRSVGFDSSSHSVTAADRLCTRLTCTTRCERPTVVCAKARKAWPDGAFDVVTVVDVLHHIPVCDQPAFLAEVATHVKPGGLLIFKDMAMHPAWKRVLNTLHDLVVARQLVRYVPLQRVTAILCERGLELTETENYSALWYAHELALLRRPK
jgi:2-polyprenyl-3-methyl-5-hydroxy-6-metoxy-1,4-benzoquinol methylase